VTVGRGCARGRRRHPAPPLVRLNTLACHSCSRAQRHHSLRRELAVIAYGFAVAGRVEFGEQLGLLDAKRSPLGEGALGEGGAHCVRVHNPFADWALADREAAFEILALGFAQLA
jgi:hypothetical protein